MRVGRVECRVDSPFECDEIELWIEVLRRILVVLWIIFSVWRKLEYCEDKIDLGIDWGFAYRIYNKGCTVWAWGAGSMNKVMKTYETRNEGGWWKGMMQWEPIGTVRNWQCMTSLNGWSSGEGLVHYVGSRDFNEAGIECRCFGVHQWCVRRHKECVWLYLDVLYILIWALTGTTSWPFTLYIWAMVMLDWSHSLWSKPSSLWVWLTSPTS